MKRLTLFITLALCLLSGCRRGLGPDADAGKADTALQTALEAWKSGKSPQDLQKESPPIIMNDDDWRGGKRLLEFTMEKGTLSGRQVRCRVRIKLQDKEARTEEREAVYIIDT